MSKNIRKIVIAIAASLILVIGGAIIFSKMAANHQANQSIIEKCFEDFGEENVVVTKGNYWSEVSCEHH